MRVDEGIAVINHRQGLERVEPERKMLEFGKLHRPGADGARPKPASRAVGNGIVIGNAADDDIDSVKIAAIAAAGEAERPAIGHFRPGAMSVTVAKGLVTACLSLRSVNAHRMILLHSKRPVGLHCYGR